MPKKKPDAINEIIDLISFPFQIFCVVFDIVDKFVGNGKKNKTKTSVFKSEDRCVEKLFPICICVNCGAEIYYRTDLCPVCNKYIYPEFPWKQILKYLLILIVFIVFSALSISFFGTRAGMAVVAIQLFFIAALIWQDLKKDK